jgi:hypothetical protein
MNAKQMSSSYLANRRAIPAAPASPSPAFGVPILLLTIATTALSMLGALLTLS